MTPLNNKLKNSGPFRIPDQYYEDTWQAVYNAAIENEFATPEKNNKKTIRMTARNWLAAASIILIAGLFTLFFFRHDPAVPAENTVAGIEYLKNNVDDIDLESLMQMAAENNVDLAELPAGAGTADSAVREYIETLEDIETQ